MSVINQDTNKELEELEELKEYATDLGISFRENIGLAKLQEKVAEKEEEIAKLKREEKIKLAKESAKKVKIIVEPRDRDAGVTDQFFGLSSISTGARENIRIQFGEEVEVSERMYEHIKSITYSEKKFKIVNGEDGMPKKEWYNKTQTRFIVSKV